MILTFASPTPLRDHRLQPDQLAKLDIAQPRQHRVIGERSAHSRIVLEMRKRYAIHPLTPEILRAGSVKRVSADASRSRKRRMLASWSARSPGNFA
jgi:hypothetical protein